MWKYGVFHAFLLYVAFAYFGFIFGILFLVAVLKIGDFFLAKFGYIRMNYGDLSMYYEIANVNHNLAGYFIMDKIDFASFKSHIYERAI